MDVMRDGFQVPNSKEVRLSTPSCTVSGSSPALITRIHVRRAQTNCSSGRFAWINSPSRYALRGRSELKRNGLVVQLVRMPPCHGGGRGFESRPVRSKKPSGCAQLRIEDGNYRHLTVLAWTSPESYVGTVRNSGDNPKVAITALAQLEECFLDMEKVASSNLAGCAVWYNNKK